MLRFVTALPKKSLNIFETSKAVCVMTLLSTNVIFSSERTLSENKGYIIFQNVLLSEMEKALNLL